MKERRIPQGWSWSYSSVPERPRQREERLRALDYLEASKSGVLAPPANGGERFSGIRTGGPARRTEKLRNLTFSSDRSG